MLGMSEPKCETLETLKAKLIAAVQHQESLVGMVTEVGERRHANERVKETSQHLQTHQLDRKSVV